MLKTPKTRVDNIKGGGGVGSFTCDLKDTTVLYLLHNNLLVGLHKPLLLYLLNHHPSSLLSFLIFSSFLFSVSFSTSSMTNLLPLFAPSPPQNDFYDIQMASMNSLETSRTSLQIFSIDQYNLYSLSL